MHFYVMDNAGNVSQGNMKSEAYYEIRESNRYSLVNGNYIQSNTGDYLKVSTYLEIVRDINEPNANVYSYDEDSDTYALDGDGNYLLHDGQYYTQSNSKQLRPCNLQRLNNNSIIRRLNNGSKRSNQWSNLFGCS